MRDRIHEGSASGTYADSLGVSHIFLSNGLVHYYWNLRQGNPVKVSRFLPLEELGKAAGNTKWFDMSRKIELFVKQEKKLNANVDFYSASTYTTLGIDIDLFTPIFAVSRISGWAAHVIEQHDDNRLIRPRADYTGPTYPAPYIPLGER